jgi:excisionase family DNA binding protein
VSGLKTVSETAAIFRVSEWTVREWCRTGKLVGRKVGRSWLISQVEINKFLEGDNK